MNFSKMTKVTTSKQFNFHIQNDEIIIFPISDSVIYFLLDEENIPTMCMQNKNGKFNMMGFYEDKIEEMFTKDKVVMYVKKGARLFMSEDGFKLAVNKGEG